MKLLYSNPCRGYGMRRLFNAVFYTTRRPAPLDSLYCRISRAGNPRVPIIPVITQWLEEGRDVQQSELLVIIKQLRKYGRNFQALQICEWSSDQMNFGRHAGNIAIRLDLISKVHGLEEAEKYFGCIPDRARITKVYGALLNCYAEHKCLEKAEATMQKMRELGFLKKTLPFNVMLSLYSRMGKTEKLDILMQEMEEKGIDMDAFTYNIRLNSYVVASDIEGMDKLLIRMEADPEISIDWNAYLIAANGYLKAGLHEKTLEMLKKSEVRVVSKKRKSAYEMLLTLYAAIQNKEEVYRIWGLYGEMGKVLNSGYLSMLSSLVKLDDTDGAKRILEEWESGNTVFDIRVPNLLITAYCNKGLLEEAEAYINRLIESGRELGSSTWERLATGYVAYGQMEKAVESIRKAILAGRRGHKLNLSVLGSCLDFLKEKGDVEVAEETVRLFREKFQLPADTCERLLNCRRIRERLLNHRGSEEPGALGLMKGNDQMES